MIQGHIITQQAASGVRGSLSAPVGGAVPREGENDRGLFPQHFIDKHPVKSMKKSPLWNSEGPSERWEPGT